MVNCEEILELLSDLVEHEMDIDFEEDITEHLSECPRCVVILSTFRKTVSLVNTIEMKRVPVIVHRHLWQVIHIEERKRRK